MSAKPLVSIIMPVYNGQEFLQESLDSIYAQAYTDYELLVMDDGSSDDTADILRRNAREHKNVHVTTQTNHGQGYARNRIIEGAKGKYILFVDADDQILPSLLAETVQRAEETKADIVHFNWKLLGEDRDTSKLNGELFMHETLLEGTDCERYLTKPDYHVADALYRNEFIQRNNIRFGEGYIYEDAEFVVQATSHAERIAIINKPLYAIRLSNNTSTTRSRHNTDKHYRAFLQAVRASFQKFRARTPHGSFYLTGNFLEKFIIYYERRVPKAYRRQYLREFVDIIHGQTIVAPKGSDYRFLRMCISRRIFADQKYRLFYVGLLHKTKILPAKAKVQSSLRKLQHK